MRNGSKQAPLRWLIALAACCMFAAAHAERADRDKPVNLEADQVTVDDNKQTATFIGNVVMTQGTLVIRGDRMVVQQDADGFKYGVSYGNLASFRQKREGYDEYIEGYAERINYISYETATEFFKVTGGGKQAATPSNPEGRVRAVIQPKPKEKPAASAPLPLKPAPDIANPRDNPTAPAATK